MAARFTRSGTVVLDEGMRRADVANPFDILHWMDEHVSFEDGLTFLELLECLVPWSAVVSVVASFDFDEWLKAARTEYDASGDPACETIAGVEISASIEVFRHDETGVAEVTTRWEPSGRLAEPDTDNGITFDIVGLDLTHPSRYARVPISIVATASVDDIMTNGKAAPWNMEPAIHPTADGGVKSFSVSPNVVDTVLYGLLGDITCAGTPERGQEVRERIASDVALIAAGHFDQSGR